MLHYKRVRRVGVVWAVLLVVFLGMNFSVTFSAAPRRRYHTVKSGETLDSISKDFGITIQEIAQENNIKDPDHIIPGQRLKIPWKGIWHTVREGEYLEVIAKTYAKAIGINWRDMMADIKQATGLYDPNKIIEGQKLFIPGAKEILPIPIPKKKPSPPQGVWHTIKQDGENIFRLALNYGEDSDINWKKMQERIMQHPHNKGIDPRNLQIGQKIFVPQAKKVLGIEIPPEVAAKEETAGSVGEERISRVKEEFKVQEPIFSWPVEGEIVGYFGEEGNEGVDIAVAVGGVVSAPADGVVEWAGEYATLGPCIVIRHEKEGFFSSFSFVNYSASLSLEYKVKKGEKVKEGEPVAEVRASEAVDSLRLHFEVHRKENIRDSVNPLDYLP